MNYPQRIVCLTEETTETLYAIGAEDRIVGISGFTVRPERARKEKPKVSAFTSAKIGRILELIGIAGGEDIFPERATEPGAKERIIQNPEEVMNRKPDIIIGSWCGRKFRPGHVAERSGWEVIPAVANNHLYEIKSPLILQPGPAALTDGLDALCEIIDRV
jgi:iron complex transport system substrate-binding protein